MTDKVFVGGNIWCYFFFQDEKAKYKIAGNFFSSKEEDVIFVISYQVINEVTNKLIQKRFSAEIIKENIEYMCKFVLCKIFQWDSVIVASALKVNCNILVSEDMRDGLKIDNMVIKNIFI